MGDRKEIEAMQDDLRRTREEMVLIQQAVENLQRKLNGYTGDIRPAVR